MNRSHDGDLCKESFESIPKDVSFGLGTLDNGLTQTTWVKEGAIWRVEWKPHAGPKMSHKQFVFLCCIYAGSQQLYKKHGCNSQNGCAKSGVGASIPTK